MEPKNTTPSDLQGLDLDNALSIVELEERFELTVAAAEADRCTIKDVDIPLI
jgi:hypothetical protein